MNLVKKILTETEFSFVIEVLSRHKLTFGFRMK
jgi:hypothetical protein